MQKPARIALPRLDGESRAEWCRRYNKEYAIVHAERRVAYRATYRAEHKEELRLKTANFRKENRDHCLAARRRLNIKNREKLNKQAVDRYKRDPERFCKRSVEYRAKNPEKVTESRKKARSDPRVKEMEAASSKIWRLANKERASEMSKAWKKANLDKHRASRNSGVRAYYLRRSKAMPAWADSLAILAVYKERMRLVIETGVPYDVDHIIPLGGKNICGLHVHYNLRVIPASENRRKGRQLLEEFLCGHPA